MDNKKIQGILESPIFNLGLGLLAHRGDPRGLLTGMNMYTQQAQAAREAEMYKLEQEQMAKKMAQQQAQQEAMMRIADNLAMQKVPQDAINATQGGLLSIGTQGPAYSMDEEKRALLQDIGMVNPDLFGKMAQQYLMPEQAKPSDLARKLQEAGFQPGTPEFQRKMTEYLFKPTGSTVHIDMGPKLPAGYQWVDPVNTDLGVKPIPGSEKELGTQGQNVAANYANRMATSEGRMDEMISSGFSPGRLSDYVAQGIPIVGNYMIDPNAQVYRQAQEDWVRAKLRKESGAVIADEEMEREIRTYFPQPGDKPETIAAKKTARQVAIDSLIAETEGQYRRKFGGQQKKENKAKNPAEAKNPTEMSDEELLKALMNGQ